MPNRRPEIPADIDPLVRDRQDQGVVRCPFHDESILLLLRHSDVRSAVADPESFSSDAPRRVPIPSEEAVRTVRQLPLEIDPPMHGKYRAITEPFFLRAKKPEVIAKVKALVGKAIESVADGRTFDAVAELALPIQSQALTYLLNMPQSEADIWVAWGTHVFKSTEGGFKDENVLEDYLNEQFDRGLAEGSDDFFGTLAHAEFDGRRLTREECLGFGSVTFAGGRDTIIHTMTSIIDHFAKHPESLEYLREDPKRITLASEEFFRVFMPLTLLGRVSTTDQTIHGESVAKGERVGVCWSTANFDEQVFDQPHEIRLDRRPNPHISFGYRAHLCQGAPHARLVIRSVIEALCQSVDKIEVVHEVPQMEREAKFERQVGYEKLDVQMSQHTNKGSAHE